MKYCPNRQCPYALRHQEGQEYIDDALICADCGAELTAVRLVWTSPGAERPALPWARIALTAAVPLIVVGLLPRVVLPRLDREEVERTLGALANEVNLSVFALGLNPLVSAFLLVELAALCVPRWRALRTGGPAGRGRLNVASHRLGFIIAGIQATGMTVYLDRLGVLESPTRLSRLILVVTLVAGSASLVAVAWLLERAALGGGFSLLVTALFMASYWPSLRPLGDEVWRSLTTAGRSSDQAMLVGGALVLACAGTVFFLGRRFPDRQVGKAELPVPACGVVPLVWGATIATAQAPGAWAIVLSLTLTAGLAVGLGFLFNRPSKVAAFGPNASGRVRRAVVRSTAFLLGLGILGWFLGQQLGLPIVNLVPLVVVAAVLLDVIAEAKAIRRYGELVAVWPEHRLYAVESALDALDRRGIPTVARSVHHRALWHFFAPFIPIQIMVPRARAEEAANLLIERG